MPFLWVSGKCASVTNFIISTAQITLGDHNSVCLSVRLSVTRVLCYETKEYRPTADILIPHERVITLV